ncbi:DUF2000 family protein [Roseateles chitinivorans]|uniref:DUF2000 family protein n=1 Tax=Roseateles chitinivorans TaxID=2917965 RepID=UPI003D679910
MSNSPSKIAIVLRSDLEHWQRLNVAAFVASGMALQPGVCGGKYRDNDGATYAALFVDPVIVLGGSPEDLQRTLARARVEGLEPGIFTEDMFHTFNDEDNRAAVAQHKTLALPLVGVSLRADRPTLNRVVKGLPLLA